MVTNFSIIKIKILFNPDPCLILFNPDPSKQALKICFFHKGDIENYPSLVFNDTRIQLANSQKHLGLILDFKLNFNIHIDSKIKEILPRKGLLTIHKSFVRPNLDYADKML